MDSLHRVNMRVKTIREHCLGENTSKRAIFGVREYIRTFGHKLAEVDIAVLSFRKQAYL